MILGPLLRRLGIPHQPPPRVVTSPPMAARVEVFRGEPRKDRKPRLWYYRKVARNGQTTEVSQGYTRKDAAKRGALRHWPDVSVIVLDD